MTSVLTRPAADPDARPACLSILRRAGLAAALIAAAGLGAAALTAPGLTTPARAQDQGAEQAQDENVIDVGPDEFYRTPSEAANVVQDGYTVRIAPGDYVDCASWRANNLTIIAPEGDVTVRDRACERKGIWVISGDDIVVEGITFQGAEVPDGNGAGIRAQGTNLTVRNCRFIENQMALLANPNPDSTIIVEGSEFLRNGPSHGVYVNPIALLVVRDSTFREHRIRHAVKSRAFVTEVYDNVIEDGEEGSSSYLVEAPNGGTVSILRNILHKGPNTDNPGVAISIGAEGDFHPSEGMRVAGNVFVNEGPTITAFVRNYTDTPVILQQNRLQGSVEPLEGPGEIVP